MTTLALDRRGPERPLVVVLGGAKVSDKIALIDRFLDIADALLIGGAMCFSFFRAQGMPTGDSLVEEEGVELARQALEKAERANCRLLLPMDLVIGDRFDAAAERREIDGVEVPTAGWASTWARARPRRTPRRSRRPARSSGTARWARSRWSRSPPARARGRGRGASARHDGGGRRRLGRGARPVRARRRVDHLSTGGGASLELLEGKPLPGVEALDDA